MCVHDICYEFSQHCKKAGFINLICLQMDDLA